MRDQDGPPDSLRARSNVIPFARPPGGPARKGAPRPRTRADAEGKLDDLQALRRRVEAHLDAGRPDEALAELEHAVALHDGDEGR